MKEHDLEGGSFEKYTILIVEDDEGLNTLIQKIIKKAGFQTKAVHTGADAILAVDKNPNLVMLLDYKLTDMTGKDVIETLRHRNRSVPFIIMTGHGDEKIAVEMMKLGALDYTVKDINFIDFLLTRLHKVIERLEIDSTLGVAVESLQKSEQKYMSLFENSLDGVYRSTSDGRFIDVNPALVEMLGYSSREELLSIDILKDLYFSPSERPSEKDRNTVITNRLKRKDGSELWVENTSRGLKQKDGSIVYEGITRDITERKQIEEALRKSEEKYRTIFDCANDGIAYMNKFGVIIEVNAEIERIIGKSVNELRGKHFSKLGVLSAKEIPKYLKLFKDAIHGEQEIKSLELNVYKDNEKVPIEVSTSIVKGEGGLEGSIAIVKNITERKKAEEQLTIFKKFAETSSLGHGFSDLKGDIIYINPTLCRMLGEEKPEDALGKNVGDFYPEDIRQKLAGEILPTVKSEGSWFGELPLMSIQGNITPTIQNLSLINDDTGNPRYFGNVITDITERKKAEEAMMGSEKRYRALFDNSSNGIALHDIITDKNGKPIDYVFLEANPAFERLTGLKVKDVLGKRVTEVLPGIEETPFIKTYGEVALTGKPIEFEQEAPQLRKRFAITAFSPRKGQFAAVFSDITERKNAEKNIELLNNLLNQSNDGIYIFDLKENRFMQVNAKACEMLGYTEEELATMNIEEVSVFPPGYSLKKEMKKVIENGSALFEQRLKRKDGTTFPIELSLKIVKIADKEYVVGVARDFTERKTAEEKLRETKTFLDNIVTSAPDAIITVGLDDKITSFSPGAEELFGYTAKEIIGESVLKLYPKGIEEKRRGWKKKIIAGEKVNVEIKQVKADDSLFTAKLSMAPLRDGRDKIIGIVGISHDITVEVKAEKALKKAYRELKKLDKMKDEFLQNISHEIRTPITAMLITIRLMKNTIRDKKLMKLLELNERTTLRLNRLVGALLDYSSLERDAMEVRSEPLKIETLIAEVVAQQEPPANKKNIEINVDLSKELPLVLGDRHAMQIIFNNLINNAVKFNKEEGIVTVKGERINGLVEITIKDTGFGIPENEVGKVFERFYQVDGTTTRRFGGTGMGLALTKKLVELQGGAIEVKSKLDSGSKFTVTLPIGDELET